MLMHLALITCSLHSLTPQKVFAMQGTLSPAQWVIAAYGASSGILLLCLETQLKFLRGCIADSFGFLFNPVLRFLFLLLTASVSWLHHHMFSDVVAVSLVVVALMNLYVMCRFVSYGELRDQFSKEEGQSLQSVGRTISNEVTNQALQNSTGTESDWL